jgi:hypothetical protein
MLELPQPGKVPTCSLQHGERGKFTKVARCEAFVARVYVRLVGRGREVETRSQNEITVGESVNDPKAKEEHAPYLKIRMLPRW